MYLIWDNTGAVGLSDSLGNSYISAAAATRWSGGQFSAQIFYAINAGSGADTVTATFATAVKSFGIVYAHEYSGISQATPLDVSVSAVGNSGSLNSGAVTTTNASDLLFAGGVSATTVTAPGPGYVARSTFQGNITEDRVVSAAGAYSATASNSAGGWGMQLVAFKGAGGAIITSPTVTSQPSSQTVTAGQTATFSVVANGSAPLSYQWQKNGSPITGANSSSYTTPVTALSDNGAKFVVVVSNSGGSVTSNAATLTVNAPVTLQSISVTPSNPSVNQSQTQQFAATGTYSDGSTKDITASVTWASSTPAIATISATTGLATGVAPGTTQITATLGSTVSPADTLTVNAPTLQSIAVSPANPALFPTQTQQFSATGKYSDGSSKDVTVTATWTSSSPAIATIGTSSGLATGVTAGTTQITATLGSVTSPSDTLTVNAVTLQSIAVTPTNSSINPSQTLQFTATGTYNDGSTKVITTSVAWTSSNPSVATIDGRLGLATGLSAGITQVTASLNSVVSSADPLTVISAGGNSYTTTFPLTENPISEGGKWINGKTVGLDWSDVRTTPGLAIGTQTATVLYDDSTAILSGTWGPDQTTQATVYTVNQSTNLFEEVELRLRTSISAHSIAGYEVNFRCTPVGNQYVQVVRWNGPFNNFTLLDSKAGPGLKTGDIVSATVVGSTISGYINGVLIVQVTDTTFTNGNPGIGFYLQSGTAAQEGDYGFTSFTASDGGPADTIPPSVPTNLAANVISSSEIDLSWTASTDNVGVLGYRVFRNSTQIATTATSSYADLTAVPGVPYAYTVAAFDAAGNVSAQSSPVNAQTVGAPDVTPPSIPANLQSSNISTTSVTLAWSASTDNVGVTGYQIFRNGTQVGTTTTATTFTDTQLTASTTYAYTVAAFDGSGNVSAQSQPLSVTTASIVVTPPSFVQANNNQIANGSAVSIAFHSATQTGNTIVVYAIWSNTGAATITDSAGNTFASIGAPLVWGGGFSAQVFYASHIAGGADTVTASFQTGVTSFGVLYVHEYSGIDPANPIDVTSSATGSSATLNSGSATTTAPNDLIFGAGVSDNSVTAAGSGFLSRDLAYGNITEDRVGASIGSYAATATHNGKIWGMQMVAFRASGAVTPPPAISVTVSPKTPSVQVGLTQQFTATVANTSNSAVTWQVNNVTGGNSTVGTISVSGLYTAPASVPSGAVTVKATSQADNTKSDTATVTVTPAPVIGVTVSPTTPTVQTGATQQFTATVTNTSNTAVTWQVNGTTGGDSAHGTISASGLFTAPTAVPSPATVTVTAISQADNTKSGSATVTITSTGSVTVTVSPKRAAITTGQTQTFAASINGSTSTSVTWEVDTVPGGNATVGTISAGGVYIPPATGSMHNVVARSTSNTTSASPASTVAVTDLAGVYTYHNDISRSGINAQEYALTASTVTSATFGKLFSCPVDAVVYAQPLWVANVNFSGVKHNVLIVATQHDTIYAFDADASSCTALWSKSLLNTGETWVGGDSDLGCSDIEPDVGIVGTPVIDSVTNTIYVASKSRITANGTIVARIHALDLITSAEKFSGPTVISGSIGSASFDAKRNNQRPGLALVGGKVYVGFGSHCDLSSYRGWLLGYTAADLTVAPSVYTTAPHATTGVESGIWMSGGAPSVDASNNLYVTTGNGTFDANSASAPNDDFGDSILKLSTTSGISVTDSFTPSDYLNRQSSDQDVGAGGVTIMPDQPSGPVPHLLVTGGKGGIMFLLNRDNLGHVGGAVQQFGVGGSSFSTPVFWQNHFYFIGSGGNSTLQSFTFDPTTPKFLLPAGSQSSESYGFPGATPSLSASGTSNGIVWALSTNSYCTTQSTSCGPAILRAYDATNVSTTLWHSDANSADAAGFAVKFTVPTVANGKVYVGTRGNDCRTTCTTTPTTPGEIDVYGLKPN
ncbi:MAG: Ig-like domain-containing protein [Acidobacteria bacterium]|nr:Ig-like domain-containing protein [Acidobacteriota bacterium]